MLVDEHRSQFGLNACLRALGVSKGSWHYRRHRPDPAARDEALKRAIVSVIADHPGYGYRRIHAELLDRGHAPLNLKRVRRLLQTYDLGLKRALPAASRSGVHQVIEAAGTSADLIQGRSFDVLDVFTTDFTEIVYGAGTQKAYLMVLVEYVTRWAGGWAVGPSRNRPLALAALDALAAALTELGHTLEGRIIHHDRDSVYTSYAWLRRVLIDEGARVSYAERGARDNPWIESCWGRFKVENGALLLEAETLEEVTRLIDAQFVYYNQERRHSALGYQRPQEVLLSMLTGGDQAGSS